MEALIADLIETVGGALVKGVAHLVETRDLDAAKAKVIEHIAADRAKTKFPDFDPT